MARSIINDGFVDMGEPVSTINVTSLIDVMFCLLIIFMVATPLMQPEGTDVSLPVAKGEKIEESEFLYSVISIDAKGNVFLGTLPLSQDPSKMKLELGKNAKLKEDGMAFIQGDQTVPFERIVDVLVALKAAEISEIGFITDPDLKKRDQPEVEP